MPKKETEEVSEEPKEEVKKEKPKQRYDVGQVATQTENVIIDHNDDSHHSEITMLCKIANDIDELKRLLK